MTLPAEKDIRLPLLRVIADAGGELPMREAIARVGQHFPELTEEDREARMASGGLTWPNRVQWVRQYLVARGHLYREPRGVWRITPEGQVHLQRHRLSRESNPLENGGDWDKELLPPEPRLHKQLQDMLAEVGSILGYQSETEYPEPPYRYDVVWKEYQGVVRANAVFEVQDKGNLIEALAKLQHAKDTWGSRLFLVVTGERDQQRVHQLVGPLLSGTFHRLQPYLTVVTSERVQGLHGALESNRELLSRLLET